MLIWTYFLISSFLSLNTCQFITFLSGLTLILDFKGTSLLDIILLELISPLFTDFLNSQLWNDSISENSIMFLRIFWLDLISSLGEKELVSPMISPFANCLNTSNPTLFSESRSNILIISSNSSQRYGSFKYSKKVFRSDFVMNESLLISIILNTFIAVSSSLMVSRRLEYPHCYYVIGCSLSKESALSYVSCSNSAWRYLYGFMGA